MAGTRAKNKDKHPAAPVMTHAAKIKAGIPSAKRQSKRTTKDEKIRELEARLAAFENPDDVDAISKEPLFLRDSSPEDVDRLVVGSEAPTEADTEDYIVVGGKRIPPSSYDPRGLKRTKTYASFNEVRPTIRNKPSGLVNNWRQVTTKTNTPLRHRSSTPMLSTPSSIPMHSTPLSTPVLSTPSPSSQVFTPSSSSQALSPLMSTSWQQDSFPTMSNATLFDPMMPAPDTITPFINQQSFPFQFNVPNQQSPDDIFQGVPTTYPVHPVVYSFARRFKDEAGKTQVPGLKDLPPNLQPSFRNTFIRHMMKVALSSMTPWSNPTLPVYQQEFAVIYPALPYRLHGDDAVVLSTNREIGVLRSQIGSEAIDAVIEYLPTQYPKRMLNSTDAKASYVTTLLDHPQHPIIWQYFRPGTIELACGEETYYDEKRRGPFQSIPVIRAFSVYYSSHGVHMRLPSNDPGRPVGALALAAAAVQRAYSMHRTGNYISTASEFSGTNCLPATKKYLKLIKALTDDDWKAIFEAVAQYQEARSHEAQVEVGAVSEDEDEPLLPADPPSSPA
ncbi:hypothetical protein BJ322DRAFT_1113390 [Thelephora terrestris]|uniref:Uncharacterized protein n=1 Tax=Thelephora terrestris TaxID=56493 RepID=A0A9P6L2P5_9AGAM|nr:hypothetical protein BJ322DRAFT_1113390 [Thelephora terrestris]